MPPPGESVIAPLRLSREEYPGPEETTQEITFSFGDSNSSILITVPGDEDFKYVVMPMRI